MDQLEMFSDEELGCRVVRYQSLTVGQRAALARYRAATQHRIDYHTLDTGEAVLHLEWLGLWLWLGPKGDLLNTKTDAQRNASGG